jgi:tRNA threonylcarbamoyladenosine biosynthesis protein TsaE
MRAKNVVYTLNQLPELAKIVSTAMDTCPIVTIQGPVGAGKTTLVRCILACMGVNEVVQSPTFSYVRTYQMPRGLLHHFDLYRVENVSQFKQFGFDEYLYQPNQWAIIEWPEIIQHLLQRDACHLILSYNADDTNTRIATFHTIPQD